MAALSRPTEATYTIHEEVTADTEDREDHTFCGIMFPVKAKDILPVHQVVINEISVRGRLGPLTVWVTKDDANDETDPRTDSALQSSSPPVAAASHRYDLRSRGDARRSLSSRLTVPVGRGQISMRPRHWTKIYSRTHSQSFTTYTALDLSDNPITLRPGQVRGVYIHSTREGDEAIVYDNKHQESTVDDRFITVMPGRAHVSETPFGSTPIWGWGNAWRDNREFVGQLKYGAVFRLWNPSEYLAFGGKFQCLTKTLFMCQRRWESPFSRLPDDCIFFILNMCHWNWADDTEEEMREMARGRRRETIRRLLEEHERQEAAAAAATASEKAEEDDGDTKMAAVSSEDLAAAVSSSTEFMVDAEEGHGDESDGEMEHGEEDDDSDEDDSDYDYEYDEYRNMNTSTFHYRDLDDEDDSAEERRRVAQHEEEQRRRSYIRSQFARIHVLRALASMSDEGEGGF